MLNYISNTFRVIPSKSRNRYRILAILYILVLTTKLFGNIYFGVVRTNEVVEALSFDSVFKTFGMDLPTWDQIKTWSTVESNSDLELQGSSYTEYTLTVFNSTTGVTENIKVKVTMNMVSVAKEIYNSFTLDGWDSFVDKTTNDTGTEYYVRVDSIDKSVSKGSGTTTKDYKALKSYFSNTTGSGGLDNSSSALYDPSKVKLEADEATDAFTDPMYKHFSRFCYVALSVISIVVIIQTICDMVWLLSPIVRTIVLELKEEEHRKSYDVLTLFVSPSALKATQCGRSKRTIYAMSSEGEEIQDVRWGRWTVRTLGAWFSLVIIFVLISSNILPTLGVGAGRAIHEWILRVVN